MTDKYAVIGNPVAHSKSPPIHAEFARQTGQDISYDRLLAPLDAFEATVRKFFDEGGKGLNVTLPFKHEAWRFSEAQGMAIGANAVNALKFERDKSGRGKISGYNTDGIGLLRDLRGNLGCGLEGKRILLMGAGGASYGVMEPLIREQPERLIVVNRTLGKALSLAAHFRTVLGVAQQNISALAYAALGDAQFDIVINATSAGLSDAMPPLPAGVFGPDALAYDMVYGKMTPFLRFARAGGARIADGTGMLVEQAAESFYLWRGVRPDTAPVIELLRRQAQG
ncbi:MAG: shikimate dehydrogenase [Pseudomonadota bacterium]